MRNLTRVFAAAAAVHLVGSFAPVWAGVVQITSQNRYVEASLTNSPVSGPADNETDRDEATGNGPFSGDAQVDVTGTDVNNCARATMTSDLTGTTWTFGGALQIGLDDRREGNPSARAAFNAVVEFTIDSPYQFQLTGGADVSGPNQGGGQLAEMLESIDPNGSSPGSERSGTLEPGSYRLTLVQEIDSVERDADFRSDYDYTFSLTQGNGGGGNNPPAVPLPPAAWAGLLTMGGMAAAQVRRRRAAARGA